MFRTRAQKSAEQSVKIREVLGNPDWLVAVTVDEAGDAELTLSAGLGDTAALEKRRLDAEAGARSVAGILSAVAGFETPTAPAEPQPPAEDPRPDEAERTKSRITLIGSPPKTDRKRVGSGARLSDEALRQGTLPSSPQTNRLPGISRILVVASAKGGVGKSTVAVNIAAALARTGMKVGLLDADVYGPSIPTMLGTADQQPATNADGKLLPVNAHGVQTLSIGYLTDADSPMIWRGPIVMSAINQMLKDAAWGEPGDPLDILVMDTPPGTGDAQLAIAQNVPVTAAIIVTTPQEVALADVRRGVAMFAKTAVPVLGIVETMSWFDDPSGHRSYIMGEGGGAAMAKALGLPLLAQIPILTEIRAGGDSGQPAALQPGPASDLFHTLARDAALGIDQLETKAPPQIVFEN
ncbi:MAG: Mrp/NBP35 family ATP-binding protein [Pseudomonadota bacterium]